MMEYPKEPQAQSQKVKERRKKFQLECLDPSLTVQSEHDRCEINNIMAKFRQTGLVEHIRQHEGRYVDVATAGDFQEAMNIVARGQQSFELLPSEIRKRFNNNPVEFLEFVHDDKNAAEMAKMGLINAPEEPKTAPEAPPPSAGGGQ